MTPSAFVFDLDGTIVDTETIEYDSVRLVWQEHGQTYPIARFIEVIGTTRSPPWLAELEHALGEQLDHGEIARRRHEYKLALLADLRPLPGVVELIVAARRDGIPLAVASNSPLAWVESRLTDLGLRDCFAAIVALDVASAPKPDPAPYREACAALGADPRRSVAFEDSCTGVHSAVAAGCYTIACPGPMTAGHDLSRSDRVVGSLADVSLERAATWLAGRQS
jgi:HAD superfamily hydrolase (TIGR01509 family)